MISKPFHISAKEDLKEINEQIQIIFKHAPAGIIVIDEEGIIHQWNPKAEILFGWEAKEVVGKFLHNVIIPMQYREAHQKGMKRFLQTGEGPVLNKAILLPALKKDHSEFDAEITISPTRIQQKYFFIGFISDVTYRRYQLDENKARLIAMVNSTDDGIIGKNLKGEIQLWNNGAENIFGYTAKEAIGQDISLIIPEEYLSEERKIIQKVQAGEKITHYETVRKRKDGRKIDVSLTLSPINDNGQKVTGIAMILRDISEKKRIEKDLAEKANYMEKRMMDFMEVLLKFTLMDFSAKATIGDKGDELDAIALGLNTLSEELEAEIKRRKNYEKQLEIKSKQLEISNKDLEYFAYIASHDLQEPLRMISSFLQLLEKKLKNKLDPEAKEYIDFAVDGSKRMKNMINDLLSYSRLISKKTQFEKININQIFKEVVLDLSEKIKETEAKVNSSSLPEIIADKVKINRIFQNLISNSLKFLRKGVPPEITVDCKENAEEYLFSIKDNGIGIKKEYCEKIFLLFQRLNRNNNFPGTGIGLAECKKIVELHGGKIWVESEIDKGSAFYFTINKKLNNN